MSTKAKPVSSCSKIEKPLLLVVSAMMGNVAVDTYILFEFTALSPIPGRSVEIRRNEKLAR